jgi:hypothetical protein
VKTHIFLPARILLTAGAILSLATLFARAQENQLEVDVRPSVADKELMWSGKSKVPGAGGHSRVYGILSVEEVKSDLRLVKPVNEVAIMELLSEELNKNGFQLYAPGQKPEIVLTVSYGRGMLQNPYMRGSAGISGAASVPLGGPPDAGAGGQTTADGVQTSTIEGAFATQLLDEKGHGFEAKLQKAQTEKLYLRVTAWDYPKGPKAKPKMLWKTLMVVDDPDHRDLNKIAAKMLEAGAPFFDKEIREREAEVYKPLPDGRVNVGAPEVVPAKSK